jgi:hypothetical protein
LIAAPGGYETCHGFEIELEDLPCSNVFYNFLYNRYGVHIKTDTATLVLRLLAERWLLQSFRLSLQRRKGQTVTAGNGEYLTL